MIVVIKGGLICMAKFVGGYICPTCLEIYPTAKDKTLMLTTYRINQNLNHSDLISQSTNNMCELDCKHVFNEPAVNYHFEYKDYGDNKPEIYLPLFVRTSTSSNQNIIKDKIQ